ncbi:S26 family signal peptidase [Actinomadura madurae]|uniref:S26 family signal peptidase n=1 Tax=Actinomadura madurae TaxID=1993 RepID=UPI000D9D2B37|nr:S26 family signal peptidase [Actinomadura madurae]SPT51749.1 signal peptidase I [Actinomadura madurae]
MTGTVLAAAAALAGTAALIAWLRRRYVVIDVDGQSMRPTLDAGDRVLVRRRSLRHVRAGDIVVVENTARQGTDRRPSAAAHGRRGASGHAWVIKRAAAVPGDPVPASLAARVSAPAGTPVPDGRMLILGDNTTASFDSRHYGYLPGTGVLGVVIRRLKAPEKTG